MKLPLFSGGGGVSAIRLRQEIFALGGRHQGEALAGALKELEDPGLTADRRSLLRAVVSHLNGKRGGLALVVSPPARLVDAAYVAVLVAAAVWVTMLVRSMLA